MMIDIVGEDQVTQEIIERLLKDYRPDITINNRLPARGGQIKMQAPKFNKLPTPVFILTDLDGYNCPPELIRDWFNETDIQSNLLFRIAQDEAEVWLMADRRGFSKWLNVGENLIPEPIEIDRISNAKEIPFPYKPSLYMMMEIVAHSPNSEIKKGLTPLVGAKKGPGYNSTILPFIRDKWDIERASQNSYSLYKSILRLKEFNFINTRTN